MKRYLLFMFDDYYPRGGFRDFFGSYDTRAEATKAALEVEKERGCALDTKQIIDGETGKLVSPDYSTESA